MNFDLLAPHYFWMEKIFAGGLMQRSRTTFLPRAKNCRRALLAGEGAGNFLVELLRANPQIEIICVEQSTGMIRQMQKQIQRQFDKFVTVKTCDRGSAPASGAVGDALSPTPGRRENCHDLPHNRAPDVRREARRTAAGAAALPIYPQVKFVQTDILHWTPPAQTFDLIVTNFFLDCFRAAQLQKLISLLAASATPDAVWLLTDFRVPERGWRRARGQIILAALYAFFKIATSLSANWLTAPDPFLSAAGFDLVERKFADFDFVHADCWRRKNP